MPDGSIVRPDIPEHPRFGRQQDGPARRDLHALLIAIHEMLPNHRIAALGERDAETISIKLLDFAMAESKALPVARDLL